MSRTLPGGTVSGFQQTRVLLGAKLRQLREQSQLNGKEMAERLGWPPSKVSRLENARQTATEEDVVVWGRAVSAAPGTQDELISMARTALEHQNSWRQRYTTGISSAQEDMRDLEARTTHIRAFEPGLIMGLLQTAEFARHIFSGAHRAYGGVDDVHDAVRVRMLRQEILYDPSRTFQFIVPEAVLRYRVVPVEVLRGQLDRLLAVTSLTNVEFGVIPFDAQLPHAFLNPFWIYNDSLVGVATKTKELVLRETEDIAFYIQAFEELRKVACFREDARQVIMRIIQDLSHATEE
ncbi:helix-turn-helix domain-containing protein [Rhizohabitans arisaemae]|uniref:helix-turn-helix domain-containing protein n=1 Tax=Rhizohabitans arisaemae TaxID=2720610 RepID=UPI0024B116A4|nr:helix-turn-helix transcriptional regulator [Rhizohabitans arisaemae]